MLDVGMFDMAIAPFLVFYRATSRPVPLDKQCYTSTVDNSHMNRVRPFQANVLNLIVIPPVHVRPSKEEIQH
jgi:hypothetical protein